MSEYGSGSGTDVLYVVEARSAVAAVTPVMYVRGFPLTSEWRRLRFATAPSDARAATLALENWLNPMSKNLGLMQFATAMSLAHWLLSCPEDGDKLPGYPAIGVEVRLVKVEMNYSYATKEIGVGAAFSSRGDCGYPFTERDATAKDSAGAKL